MSRWFYVSAFAAVGLVVGTATALSLYFESLDPGARAAGLAGYVILGLVPNGMFLGTTAAVMIGLPLTRRIARTQRRRSPVPVDGLDMVLGALTSVSGLPFAAWAVAAAMGPILAADFGAGAQQGYRVAAEAGLGLALLAGLLLFRRVRPVSPAFAYTLAASACLITPVLWGIVQVESMLTTS